MKNFLLFFFLFVSMPLMAQKQDFCVFDFGNPLQLSPSVTPISGNAQIVNITDSVFRNGPIRISFIEGPTFTGAQLATFKYENEPEYYQLKITKSTTIVFSAVNGASLDSIKLSDDSTIGDISVIKKDKEKGDFLSRQWSAPANYAPIDSISFMNAGHPSLWSKITVHYTTESAILKPNDMSIKDGSEIPFFSSLILTFADNMSVIDSSNIKLFNSDSSFVQKLKVSSSGKSIKLFVDNVIETDGVYTISIPAKSFESKNGYHNSELKYTFKINIPKNTFDFTSLTLDTGRVEFIKSGIILTYPTPIIIDTTKSVRMFKDGYPYCSIVLTKIEDNDNQLSLDFLGISNDITDNGIYTIDIPEATIYNAFKGDPLYERYNPDIILNYEISEEPLEDTEVMKSAKALLLKSGLGYPKETSAKRLALKALTEAEEIPTDDQLTAAIGEFYNETDVVLPDSGIWYTIASVNANGDKLYLYYNDGTVTLTDDAKKATAFMADSLKASTSFKTIDGKYLHVLSAAQDGKFDATSSKNVTETYDSLVNNLVLAKLAVKEVDSVKTFGLFSLYGSLGKDIISEVPMSTYAQISHTNKTVISDPNYPLLFTENNTGAFVLEQTEKPELLADSITLAYNLSPSIVADTTEMLNLTFNSDVSVCLSKDYSAYFTDALGNKVKDASFVPDTISDVKYTIALNGLSVGNYRLIIPDGTFFVLNNGAKAFVRAMNIPFGIGKGGSGSDGGFDTSFYSFALLDEPSGEYVKSDIFKNYVLYVDTTHLYNEMIPDTCRQVVITLNNNINDTIATGHFIKHEMAVPYCGIKLVLDEDKDNPITLKSGVKYAIIIEEATFGDKNFGKYLADRTSINPSECKVNQRTVIGYHVNDEYFSSGINIIKPNNDSSITIYDLFGRKLDKITSNGIYIINGKKVVVRNKSK
ncbi:MAG: hypothetical protein IKA00_15230 [Prevotella sp.]|nr:hypothetical protein [Prevotella sp.]